jgi:hypothetical protein
MKKLGDKVKENCEKCNHVQIFEVSEISEYGEAFGICEKCKNVIRV